MHRLLKLRSLSLQQISVVSKSGLANNPIRLRDRSCELCKQSSSLKLVSSVSDYSTHTNPVIEVSKKRRRTKKPKSYAEILEVTEQSHTEGRASVKKLKAKDLSLLAQEPEIGLGELHKIRARSRFINNNPADPTLTTVDVEEIVELESQESAALAEDQIDLNDEPSVENFKTGKQRERAGKEEALNRNLGAHVEMCVAIGNPQRGLTSMIYYRYRAAKHNGPPVKNINIYNTLLQGFAAKTNINKVKEILKYMREDDIKLNVQSFVAILECLGRVYHHSNRTKVIRHYLSMMNNQGISCDDLMNKAEFVCEQREIILSVIRRVHVDFIPTYKPPNVQYTCDMLENLNSPDQLVPVDKDLPGSDVNERLFSREQLKELMKQQLEIEMDGYVKVKSIESKPEPSQQVLEYRELLSKVMGEWEDVASQAFKRDLDILIAQPRQGSKTLALDPYLRCLPVSDYIQVIINEVRRLAEGSETYSPTTNQLYRELGSRVYTRYLVQRKLRDEVLRKVCTIHELYGDWYSEHYGRGSSLNSRQQWQWLAHERREGASVNGAYHHAWPSTTMIAVGEFLYKIIMHEFKVDVNVIRPSNSKQKLLPAFYTLFRSQGRIVKEEVKPHPVLARLYRGASLDYLTFPAHEVPMRCPPRPWIGVGGGGYLLAPCEVVRLPTQAVTQWHRLTRAPPNTLYPPLDSLNQLQTVPWRVNEEVLGVILEVFNSGGSSRLDVPQPPSACPSAPPVSPTMTKAEKFMAFKQRMQVRRRKAEMYSLWCDALYRLSLANHFKDDVFWLPHNMDFRGRVYPVPPHLNHLGSDLARSMLVFAESRPLGRDGLDWLKIHCINLTGLKKRDRIEDRLYYANEIMPEILDSADHPLTGNMWWAQSDEPWQTLACCLEIARASRSPNPSTYKSRYPVHQDGSCNGLQHYAALGRDSAGAFSVNLVPASVPQDVYSAVATLVEEQRAKDAEGGIKVAQVLDGFVRRKVIKQTVMTTVYGVTRFGARLQIARQLKDIEDFPKDMVWTASSYLTSKTFESLRSMFTSTREIQDWFTECARLISAVNGQNVEWVTPLGLPVVQPYSRHRKIEQATKMVPENFNMDMFERPNVMKQKNAFPPNFIHSLDSSHMMLTSLFCERAGITFVSVHDCFWTHPCSVHIMNEVTREQFVALHSQPILEDLSKFLVKKYSYKTRELTDDGSVGDLTRRKLNKVLKKIPSKGDFDLNSVLNSIYFFS